MSLVLLFTEFRPFCLLYLAFARVGTDTYIVLFDYYALSLVLSFDQRILFFERFGGREVYFAFDVACFRFFRSRK